MVHINDPAAGKAHVLMDTLPRIEEEDIVDLLHKFGYEKEGEKTSILFSDSEAYAKAITRTTKDFDLLIMGHHPKSRFIAALKDSTDERVADRIDCPIMLVPLDSALQRRLVQDTNKSQIPLHYLSELKNFLI